MTASAFAAADHRADGSGNFSRSAFQNRMRAESIGACRATAAAAARSGRGRSCRQRRRRNASSDFGPALSASRSSAGAGRGSGDDGAHAISSMMAASMSGSLVVIWSTPRSRRVRGSSRTAGRSASTVQASTSAPFAVRRRDEIDAGCEPGEDEVGFEVVDRGVGGEAHHLVGEAREAVRVRGTRVQADRGRAGRSRASTPGRRLRRRSRKSRNRCCRR